MKRLLNLKMIILTSLFVVALLLLGTTTSKAALQANPTTHASPVGKMGATWIKEIRQMEAPGQTMGLSEQINENLDSTTGDNNIDVHMIKSTEYGAISILAISGFGNKNKLQDSTIKSTTGNETGVYFDKDIVVAGVQSRAQVTGNSKYYNRYGSSYVDGSTFVGDGLGNRSWTRTPGAMGDEQPNGQVLGFHGTRWHTGCLFGSNFAVIRTGWFGLMNEMIDWTDNHGSPSYGRASRGVAV